MKLTNLNNYYTTQINRSKLSGLKLSDVIGIKNLLVQKISKEMQGLRTASADYADLDKVDPKVVSEIMKRIKAELKN